MRTMKNEDIHQNALEMVVETMEASISPLESVVDEQAQNRDESTDCKQGVCAILWKPSRVVAAA